MSENFRGVIDHVIEFKKNSGPFGRSRFKFDDTLCVQERYMYLATIQKWHPSNHIPLCDNNFKEPAPTFSAVGINGHSVRKPAQPNSSGDQGSQRFKLL